MDLNAYEAHQISHISHRSCKVIYAKLRLYIVKQCVGNRASTETFELDESYFGTRPCSRKKRARSSRKDTCIWTFKTRRQGLCRDRRKNCSRNSLLPIIQGKILEGSTIHTDGWKAYDGLILNGYDHYRVYHSKNEFARGKCHVNGIESFWSFAKRRLAQFNGLAEQVFYLHLKECEFRFNNRKANLYAILLKELRKKPL